MCLIITHTCYRIDMGDLQVRRTEVDRMLYNVERLGLSDIDTADVRVLKELAGATRDVRAWRAAADVAIPRRTNE